MICPQPDGGKCPDLEDAFSRNLGWVTEPELERLSHKRIAVAGLGGVGGHYAELLARLGIADFHLADMDCYEIQNFNRQNGSGISTLGEPKAEVLRRRILDINPRARVALFSEGIHDGNMDSFLEGVDLYLDGLDLFALDERIELFARLRARNIPAVTVAPIGMGASLVVFDSHSMSFEKYFGLRKEMPEREKCLRFLIGVAPSLVHARYFMDPSRVNLAEHKTPSTPMGCYLCAGVAGTMALKILLGRGPIHRAPWSFQFDSYLQRYVRKFTRFGYRHPMQRLRYWYLRART